MTMVLNYSATVRPSQHEKNEWSRMAQAAYKETAPAYADYCIACGYNIAADCFPPYPWCNDPKRCCELGYCPRDPNCGE